MGQKSEHFRVIAGGFVAFEQSPLIGIGPGNYTLLSPEILKIALIEKLTFIRTTFMSNYSLKQAFWGLLRAYFLLDLSHGNHASPQLEKP